MTMRTTHSSNINNNCKTIKKKPHNPDNDMGMDFFNDDSIFDKRLKKFMINNKNILSFDQVSNESECSDIKKIYDSSIESDLTTNYNSHLRNNNIPMKRQYITNNNIQNHQKTKKSDESDDDERNDFSNESDFEIENESIISINLFRKSECESCSDDDKWINTNSSKRPISNIGSIDIILGQSKTKNPIKDDIPYDTDDDDDDDDDDEVKQNRDRYIKHMDSIVKNIKEMKWGDTIMTKSDPNFITNDQRSQKMCAITKVIRYSSYVFNGYGSKNILRYFMSKTKNDPEYGFQKIVQILNDKGFRRFIPIKSWDTFWKDYRDEPIKNRYLFELIRSDQPCKPYLDIEWIQKKEKDPRKQNYSEFINKLQTDIINIFQERYDIEIDTTSIMISTSHSASKVSFHVVIDKQIGRKTLAFRTNRRGCPESAWDMYIALIELDASYDDVLDGTVYTTDREFRVLYSNKTTEFRPFIPYSKIRRNIDEDSVIKMSNPQCMRYIVTYSRYNEYHHIVTPEVPQKYAVMNRTNYDPEIFIPPTYTDGTINHLIHLAQKIHHTAEYTGRSTCGKGWRFSYRDKTEPCYTGNYHESNGFYIYENKEKCTFYMKCQSDKCNGIRVLENKKAKVKVVTKKLF
jgi:hypothetical protein